MLIKFWALPMLLVLLWVLATAYTMSELATAGELLRASQSPLLRSSAAAAPPMLRRTSASMDRPARRAGPHAP